MHSKKVGALVVALFSAFASSCAPNADDSTATLTEGSNFVLPPTPAEMDKINAIVKSLSKTPWIAYLLPLPYPDPWYPNVDAQQMIQGVFTILKNDENLCSQIGNNFCYDYALWLEAFAAKVQGNIPMINFALVIGNYSAAWELAAKSGLTSVLETPAGFRLMNLPAFTQAQMTAFYKAAVPYWNIDILGTNPYPPTLWGDPANMASDAIANFNTSGDNKYPDIARFAAKQPPVSWVDKWFPLIDDIIVGVATWGISTGISTAFDATFDITSYTGVALVQAGTQLGLSEIETYFQGGSPVETLEDTVLDFALFGPNGQQLNIPNDVLNNVLNGVLYSTETSAINQLVNSGKINWGSVAEGYLVAAATGAIIKSTTPSPNGNGGASYQAIVPASTEGPGGPVLAPVPLTLQIDFTTPEFPELPIPDFSMAPSVATITAPATSDGINAMVTTASYLSASTPTVPAVVPADAAYQQALLEEIVVTAQQPTDPSIPALSAALVKKAVLLVSADISYTWSPEMSFAQTETAAKNALLAAMNALANEGRLNSAAFKDLVFVLNLIDSGWFDNAQELNDAMDKVLSEAGTELNTANAGSSAAGFAEIELLAAGASGSVAASVGAAIGADNKSTWLQAGGLAPFFATVDKADLTIIMSIVPYTPVST
jgi:hypothetical protein